MEGITNELTDKRRYLLQMNGKTIYKCRGYNNVILP